MIDRTSSIVDYEIGDNTGRDGLLPLAGTGRRATKDAMKVRDALSEFFSDQNGSVERKKYPCVQKCFILQ